MRASLPGCALALCATWAACARAPLPPVHVATAAHYPEGPVVTDDGLLFVEFSRDRVMRWQQGQATQVWHRAGCGPAGLAALPDGDVWIACHTQHQLLRVATKPPQKVLQMLEVPYPNDLVLDAHGGLYVTASGEFDAAAPVTGAVHYVDPNGELAQVATGIHYSNGIALSRDGTQLVVSEHLQNRLRTYDVVAPGQLAAGHRAWALRAFAAHPASADHRLLGPDGLAVDARGHVWVGHYAGGRLLHLDADGQVQTTISFAPPLINVTNVAPHADGRVFVTLTSDDAEAGHPGAVVALQPAAFTSRHVHCSVDPPTVTCLPL